MAGLVTIELVLRLSERQLKNMQRFFYSKLDSDFMTFSCLGEAHTNIASFQNKNIRPTSSIKTCWRRIFLVRGVNVKFVFLGSRVSNLWWKIVGRVVLVIFTWKEEESISDFSEKIVSYTKSKKKIALQSIKLTAGDVYSRSNISP